MSSAKQHLRTTLLERRRAVTPEARRSASRQVCETLLALPALADAGTVAVYAALDDELDPADASRALAAGGIAVAYPRVRGAHLDLIAVTDPTTLRPGHLGILEPTGDALDVADLDVVLVPGVAFDPDGHRLGRGGGHYDRLLASVPSSVRRVGLAYAFQVVDAVPHEDHDETVDVVVTEAGTVVTGRSDG